MTPQNANLPKPDEEKNVSDKEKSAHISWRSLEDEGEKRPPVGKRMPGYTFAYRF
jgi:hypothetical protein